MTRNVKFAIAGALLAAMLGACSGSDPEPQPTEESEGVEAPEPATSTVESAPVPLDPAPVDNATVNATVADVPDAPLPPPDEQMLDDASATGMTARANRDEQSAEQPAETEREQAQ